jgi:hypothetical protein
MILEYKSEIMGVRIVLIRLCIMPENQFPLYRNDRIKQLKLLNVGGLIVPVLLLLSTTSKWFVM